MITAVDTSVLLDVFVSDPSHVAGSQALIRRAIREGSLVACEVVWAELRPCFDNDESLVRAMQTLGVSFSSVSREAALLAGATWSRYRASGGTRDRMIPDFLIASHAQTTADRFLTRDRGFYRQWFQGLSLLDATTAG